jgi:hypothetical protein
MAKHTPTVRPNGFHATLQVWRDDPMLGQYRDDYHLGSEKWFLWLGLTNSQTFRFEPINTTQTRFTARREERGNDSYWYGYKRITGKLHKLYIGRSLELTLERLEEVAIAFENLRSNGLQEKSHTTKNRVASCSKNQPMTQLSQEKLEAIGQELLNDSGLTRNGKDRGTVKRTITAFTERLALLLEG